MKYTVSAVCIIRYVKGRVDPTQGTDRHGDYKRAYIRDETIDTDKNEIFKGCKNEYAVEDRYEEFWNRLNGGYKNSEIVKVVNVVKEESK